MSIEYQKEAYTHGCLLLLLKSFCTLLFGDEILNRFPRDNRTEARERASRFFVALTLPFLGIVILIPSLTHLGAFCVCVLVFSHPKGVNHVCASRL